MLSLERQQMSVRCLSCSYMNPISIKQIYDGFEGDFLCRNCGDPLDNLHSLIEE